MAEFEGRAKPGEVRNPGGKNGLTPITDSLRALLSREDNTYDDKPLNNAQKIALEWAKKAKNGDLAAITSLTDRVEGKPKDKIEHSGSITLEGLVAPSMNLDDAG